MDKKRLHDDVTTDLSSVTKKSRLDSDTDLNNAKIIDITVDFFYIW